MTAKLSDLIEQSLAYQDIIDARHEFGHREGLYYFACPLSRAAAAIDVVRFRTHLDTYPKIRGHITRLWLTEHGVDLTHQIEETQHTEALDEPTSACFYLNHNAHSVETWVIHLADEHHFTAQQIIEWLRERGL